MSKKKPPTEKLFSVTVVHTESIRTRGTMIVLAKTKNAAMLAAEAMLMEDDDCVEWGPAIHTADETYVEGVAI